MKITFLNSFKTFHFTKRSAAFIVISCVLFGIDALLKVWANDYFSESPYTSSSYPYGGIGVFHNLSGIDFCINRVTNLGAAWGIFHSTPYLLFAARLIIIFALTIYACFFNPSRSRDIPFLLILTGAFGNLFDFIFYGYVIDFFHFTLWGYSFPVFNLSDTLVFFGAAILLIQSFTQKKKKNEKNQKHSKAAKFNSHTLS